MVAAMEAAMRASVRLTIVATIAALAIPILGGSALAAFPPHVAVVQGIPGKTVDVCIGNNEVKSNLRYGKWFERTVGVGNRTIRFRTAAAGSCAGQVIIQKTRTFALDDDVTIVVTSKAPKVLVFDNGDLGAIPATTAEVFFAFRHAADVGPLTFKMGGLDQILTPAADPIWEKGDEATGLNYDEGLVSVAVTRPDSDEPLASVASHYGLPESVALRSEWYAIGSKLRNLRIITFTRHVID
jgi:hypothetical protein